jgi:hypothetical protein
MRFRIAACVWIGTAIIAASRSASADPDVPAPPTDHAAPTGTTDAPAAAQPTDPTAPLPPQENLPFAIANEKRLEDEELSGKKEGIFFSGVPDVSLDPLNGLGLGVEGYMTYNGSRQDPFFAYTPYRSRLSVAAFITTKNQQSFEVGLDVPYIFDSPWRVRTLAGYANDPNQLYFGTTQASLNHLRSLFPAASPFAGQQVGSFDTYEDRLATVRAGGPGEPARVADNFFNSFRLRQALLNGLIERSILESTVRLVAGFEVAYDDVSTYEGRDASATDPATGNKVTVPNGTTRLSQDAAAGKVIGMGHGFVNILQVAAVYDTRDFEPDPTHGIFAELTNEFSAPPIGSRFTFDKVFGQFKGYQKFFGYGAQRLVAAGRLGAGCTLGGAPFFEYQDEWSTEDNSVEALGGAHTLRGYKQGRFVARYMAFANAELRYRFARFSILSQELGLVIVPFVDTGGAWDRPTNLTFRNLRISEGAGLRVSWNQSTIVSFDYGVSEEDHQLFVALGHAF